MDIYYQHQISILKIIQRKLRSHFLRVRKILSKSTNVAKHFLIKYSMNTLMGNVKVQPVELTLITTKTTVLKTVSFKILLTEQFIHQEILNFYLKIVHLLKYLHQKMVVQFALTKEKLSKTEFVHTTAIHQNGDSIVLFIQLKDNTKITLSKVLYQVLVKLLLETLQHTFMAEVNTSRKQIFHILEQGHTAVTLLKKDNQKQIPLIIQ